MEKEESSSSSLVTTSMVVWAGDGGVRGVARGRGPAMVVVVLGVDSISGGEEVDRLRDCLVGDDN